MERSAEMIGVDTNVLLRFLVEDEPDQNRQAKDFLSACTQEVPAYVSAVTLAETVWILNRRLKFLMRGIAEMVRALLEADEIVLEHAEELGLLLHQQPVPSADFADYLIAWSNGRAGCSRTMTFDKRAAKSVPGMELLQ